MKEIDVKKNLIKGSIAWYPFRRYTKALIITGVFSEFEVLSEYLESIGIIVDIKNICEIDNMEDCLDKKNTNHYDYVIMALSLEMSDNIIETLKMVKRIVADDGKVLILADNRLAIKYFSGEKDIFSGKVFDGCDNYINVNLEKISGKSYSKDELKKALVASGFENKFFGVFPSFFNANILIADGYKVNENLMDRINPYYMNPDTVFMDERFLYNTLRDNHLLITMANGFFIECSCDGKFVDYMQVTVQGNRDRETALATYVKDKTVDKRLLWDNLLTDGEKSKLSIIEQNSKYLASHGVLMADCELANGLLTVPYISGTICTEYFQNLLENDIESFLKEFDSFVDVLGKSSEHVPYNEIDWSRFDPYWDKQKDDDPNKCYWENLANGSDENKAHIGPILKRGYLDLTTINCVKTPSGFVFFDQEFYVENLPVKALIFRAIAFIYSSCAKLGECIKMDELLERYDLLKDRNSWFAFTDRPLKKILHFDEINVDIRSHSVDFSVMNANRLRMNYSQEEYEKYFVDIFRDVYNYKCYIFGSGKFAERFLELYGDRLDNIVAIDNNKERWGTKIGNYDVEVMSPDVLRNETERIKVFICIKYYEDVLKQLKEIGVKNISIYNARIMYPLPRRNMVDLYSDSTIIDKSKPYNIGYVAGVFDLFHVGHVNLLRRAKEHCKYLIVGIVSDEQVIKNKKTSPYYSFEDRFEIVKSSKYVDEVVKIPINRSSTEDAYKMYRFDVQFSGSDYKDDPSWLASREYLRKHGSDLVFFSYTESVSSTMIKEKIRGSMCE